MTFPTLKLLIKRRAVRSSSAKKHPVLSQNQALAMAKQRWKYCRRGAWELGITSF
jgi:hypothetical protein